MKPPVALALALLLLSSAVPPVTATHGTTHVKAYTAGTLGTFLNSCEQATGIGGVRFCGIEDPAPASVSITIVDLLALPIGAAVKFVDAAQQTTWSGNICGSAALAVPPGSKELWVFVGSTSVLGGCPSHTGTRGTVTVTWSAATGPAAPPTQRAAYVLPTGIRIAKTPLTTGPITAGGSVTAGVGGGLFDPNGLLPVQVTAVDQLSSTVGLFVCQNLNNDLFCGELGDPGVRGCGTVDLSASSVPFVATSRVIVFVQAFDQICNAAGARGTITVTYAA